MDCRCDYTYFKRDREYMNKEELIDLVQDWSNQDKAQAIALLKKSMSESVSTRTDKKVVESYVKDAIKQGLLDGKLKDYPEANFERTSRSMIYKEVIQTVVKDIKDGQGIDASSRAAWTHCENAKNLVDFRKAFKMYCTILKSETYTIDEVQEYVVLIDELDRENRKLKDYRRIYNEIFGVISEDDAELNIVLKANKMKESNFTDKEIC